MPGVVEQYTKAVEQVREAANSYNYEHPTDWDRTFAHHLSLVRHDILPGAGSDQQMRYAVRMTESEIRFHSGEEQMLRQSESQGYRIA